MKTFNRTFLPESIEYNGKEYKMDSDLSSDAKDVSTTAMQVKAATQGKSVIMVKVLAKNLRGVTDIHSKPYQPSVWIFSCAK